MRVDLPSGGWAEIRDPTTLTERQRRPLRLLMAQILQDLQRAGFVAEAGNPESEAQALGLIDADKSMDLEYAAVGAFVSAWSFDSTPSADAALDLQGGDFDKLRDEVLPLMQQTMLDVRPTTDAASPTVPSSASGTRFEGTPLLTLAQPGGTTASSASG